MLAIWLALLAGPLARPKHSDGGLPDALALRSYLCISRFSRFNLLYLYLLLAVQHIHIYDTHSHTHNHTHTHLNGSEIEALLLLCLTCFWGPFQMLVQDVPSKGILACKVRLFEYLTAIRIYISLERISFLSQTVLECST